MKYRQFQFILPDKKLIFEFRYASGLINVLVGRIIDTLVRYAKTIFVVIAS